MLVKLLRIVITLALAALAVLLGAGIWRYYMESPWTRDGRVRADVVNVAPEVAGTVVQVAVSDNQYVKKGDVLFEIDPSRFRLAVAQAEAELNQRKRELDLRNADKARRAGLAGVVSAEEVDRTRNTAEIAAAGVATAQVALDIARLNLERTVLRAPVNGFVTNLNFKVGDFIAAGNARIALLDADSFYVTGYFEETKMKGIHPGDPARMALMGYDEPLKGHVESIGRGITDPNARPDQQGLPEVNPVFTWVRLAQRIPVKFRIDEVPLNDPLVAGMTCTVTVLSGTGQPGGLATFFSLLEGGFSRLRSIGA